MFICTRVPVFVCVTGLVSYQRNGCVGPIRESPAGGDALEMAPWQLPGQGGVCICAALALDCSCGGWRWVEGKWVAGWKGAMRECKCICVCEEGCEVWGASLWLTPHLARMLTNPHDFPSFMEILHFTATNPNLTNPNVNLITLLSLQEWLFQPHGGSWNKKPTLTCHYVDVLNLSPHDQFLCLHVQYLHDQCVETESWKLDFPEGLTHLSIRRLFGSSTCSTAIILMESSVLFFAHSSLSQLFFCWRLLMLYVFQHVCYRLLCLSTVMIAGSCLW